MRALHPTRAGECIDLYIYILHEFWKLGSVIWFLVCSAWWRVKWPRNISELFWLGLSLCQTSVQDLCLLTTRSSNRRCWKALMPLQVKMFLGCPFFVIHSTPQYLQLYKAFQPVLPILFTISRLCIVTVLASLQLSNVGAHDNFDMCGPWTWSH